MQDYMLNTDIGHTYTTLNRNTRQFQTRFSDFIVGIFLTNALTPEAYLLTIHSPIPELPDVGLPLPGATYPINEQPVPVYTHACASNRQRQ